MNRKASPANPLLVALLLLVIGVPYAFAQAAADDKKNHDMSPEAKILSGPPAEGSFAPDPVYPEAYNAKHQLDIYDARHMNPNPTGVPPVELGDRKSTRLNSSHRTISYA